MKTRDAVELTFMAALAIAITILVGCLAAFPIVPSLAGFGICLGTLFITVAMVTQIEPRKP